MANSLQASGLVQERQQDDGVLKAVQVAVFAAYRQHFGTAHKLRFVWLSLPPGQAYVAGRQSRTSSLQIPVPDGTDDAVRHRFMAAVCTLWMEATGCEEDEIVVSVPDLSYAQRFAAQNLARLAGQGRVRTRLQLVSLALLSKLRRRGIAMMSINLSRAA